MMQRFFLALLLALAALRPLAAQESWQQQALRQPPEELAAEAAQAGDPQRGAIVFFQAHMACGKCHVPDAREGALAPDLTKLEKTVTNAHLAEAILAPSKVIRTGFETITLTTTDGRAVQGLLVEQTRDEVVLREPVPGGKLLRIAKKEIEEQAKSPVSAMPAGQIEQLASRQQLLDLVKYLIELRDGGAKRARELQPDPLLIAAAPLPEYESHLDHAQLIRGWNKQSFERGEAIYRRVCANCHGTHDQPGSLPTSLRFAEGKFKNGHDPYAMYQTMTRGFGFMTPQTWMVPQQKYDVIHYIREAYLKEKNASQYTAVDDAYLKRLPKGDTVGPAPSNIQPWSAMDYGPSLINTYEIRRGHIAMKALAVRLDAGPGGMSRGRQWLAFDHDLLSMAGIWQGEGFIDWRGIHFNGEHNAHPKIVGQVVAANSGVGWANPANGALDDPRPKARDGRPYGPLLRQWAQFRGVFAHGERTIWSYSVGTTDVLESAELIEMPREKQPAEYAYARQFELGRREKPLTLVVATEPEATLRGGIHGPVAATKPVEESKAKASTTGLALGGTSHLDIAAPTAFDMTDSDYTIVARLRTKGDGTLFAQTERAGAWPHDGKALFVRGGRLVFDIGWVGAVASKRRVDDGEWHVVAMSWRKSDARVRLWIDGRLDGEGKLRPKGNVQDFAVRIGFASENFPDPSPFAGELSAVAYHARELVEKELGALKTTDEIVSAQQPAAAWNLIAVDEQGIYPDATGNKHDAKLVGQPGEPAAALGPLAAAVSPPIAGSKLWWDEAGRLLLEIPAGDEPLAFNVCLSRSEHLPVAMPAPRLAEQTRGGPRRWSQTLTTTAKIGPASGPFATDILTPPDNNPWLAQLRLTGIDFFADGDRAAVTAWDGDVWLVSGLSKLDDIEQDRKSGDFRYAPQLTWQRIATGLFQPLGVKILNEQVFVTCRDQIVILRDKNGDGETDFYECFNNDHQVTEHFHEFAMGLQSDADGNLYYAKSARHALTALVPHHGTLLRVSQDGAKTDILANGFRAANGVCLNPDGSFIVTDQEGHWNPKNRINWVTLRQDGKPKFYGNMFGYHDRTDNSDAAMEPPLCWITNAFDRSPSELLWVTSDKWGPLQGSLLNLSYGYGKVFLVPHEQVRGVMQGGMIELPMPNFPTGVMRGRFHPRDGQLYLAGMFAWAGNATQPGGLYRLRYTGKEVCLPLKLHATQPGMELTFSAKLDRESATNAANYAVKVWGLKRSANYGSPHIDEHPLKVTSARLDGDGRTLLLQLDGLAPTWGMEIAYELKSASGEAVKGKIHNTIHALEGKRE